MTCDVSAGREEVTIHRNGQDFTLEDQAGNGLFQAGPGGSQIAVSNVEHGQMIEGSEVLHES